ncbi:MAG TPA: PKD domain-containing protein, partial [bacterium]|nr:PKD domain-containing protein [bacterium]
MRLNPGLICGVLVTLLSAVPSALWAADMGPKVGEKTKFMAIVEPAGIAQRPPISGTLTASAKYGAEPYTFAWDLNEDGVYDSTEPSVQVSADKPGMQKVSLVVTDANGQITEKTVVVRAFTPVQEQESLGYLVATVSLLIATGLFFIYFLAGNPRMLGRVATGAFVLGFAALVYSNV